MRVPVAAAVSLAALALAAIACAGAVAGGRGPDEPGSAAAHPEKRIGVNFFHNCRFSHKAPDDPIVFPGEPGASHLHTFVGNRTTDSHSTYRSLRSGATTCKRPADRAAYWTPALYAGTRLVLPTAATIYYRRNTLAEVRPLPPNLHMIAGSAMAKRPQGTQVTFWSCGFNSEITRSVHLVVCPQGESLHLHIRFPECWDGRHLDSADHKSHMTYMRRARCPASHPIAVPGVAQIYRYPVRGGTGITLASGGAYSGHADFINAWEPSAFRRLVDGCLNRHVHRLCRPE